MEITTNKINNIFKTPRGYKVTHIFGTSYSVNGSVLNDVIKQTVIHRNEEFYNNVLFVCQNNRYVGGLGKGDSDPVARILFLEERIIGVEQSGSFHPKVWIFRYENKKEAEKILYRVAVLSRNTTSQNMLEGGIVLEGFVGTAKTNSNQGLIDFINSVEAVKGDEVVKQIIEDMEKVEFETEGFDSYAFLPTKNTKNKTLSADIKEDIKENIKENKKVENSVAISPFLGNDNFLNVKNIITRQAEYTEEVKTNFQDVNFWYIEDTDSENTSEQVENDSTYSFSENEHPLHAKVYAFDYIGESVLYAGSANYSENGFNNNTELMIKITSNKIKFAEAIMNSFNGRLKPITNIYDSDKEEPIEPKELPNISQEEKSEEKEALLIKIKNDINNDLSDDMLHILGVGVSKPKNSDSKENDDDKTTIFKKSIKDRPDLLASMIKVYLDGELDETKLENLENNAEEYGSEKYKELIECFKKMVK